MHLQLYRVEKDSSSFVQQLTWGEWMVEKVLGVDAGKVDCDDTIADMTCDTSIHPFNLLSHPLRYPHTHVVGLGLLHLNCGRRAGVASLRSSAA